MSFQLAGLVLNGISRLHNEWAANVLSRLWFTVFKSKPKPWVEGFWAGADARFEVTVGTETIPVYAWGQGPVVVTMHGWSGSGTQFRQFIPALVDAGFRVISFDAPAHGSNPGRQSDLIKLSESLLAIQHHCGDLHGLIAHSMGGMASVYAIQRGLKVRRLVLVAPHLEVESMFETYRDMLGMRPALAQRFYEKIGTRMAEILGDDPWDTLNPVALLQHCDVGGLLVHDRYDPEVPTALFAEIERLWRDSSVFRTEGLGHNRLLKDATVVAEVAGFLRASLE